LDPIHSTSPHPVLTLSIPHPHIPFGTYPSGVGLG
jgi:hypothetical protein